MNFAKVLAQPQTDKALYKALYKFDGNTELNDYLQPLEQDKPKERKLTKFDILMMNPKYLPKRKHAKKRLPPIEKSRQVEDEPDIEKDE